MFYIGYWKFCIAKLKFEIGTYCYGSCVVYLDKTWQSTVTRCVGPICSFIIDPISNRSDEFHASIIVADFSPEMEKFTSPVRQHFSRIRNFFAKNVALLSRCCTFVVIL